MSFIHSGNKSRRQPDAVSNMSGQEVASKYLKISVPQFVSVVVGLPIFASIFCVIWSILFNFNSSTATHCGVANYLPTVSSAIGGYAPQRYVWRACIALHCAPRFLFAVGYYGFHTSIDVGKYNRLYTWTAALITSIHICENLALVGLTYVSSTENSDFHENSFVVFMVCALVYMLLTCIVFYWGRACTRRCSKEEWRSLRYKVYLFLVNIFSFFLAVYLYFRHNSYCEPGVYTWFAACEYITVLSNIAFHATVILDWREYTLLLGHNDFVNQLEGKID